MLPRVLILLGLLLALECLVIRPKGPQREDVLRFLRRRFQDDNAEPKPSADFLIGSDQQRVELMLDFTSRDTWVVDRNCGNELCYMGNVGFDPTTSTSFKNSTIPFKGNFYDETDQYHTVSGHAVIDTMMHSTYPQNNDSWTSVFALAQQRDVNRTIGNWPYHGSVGLAPGAGDLLDPVFPHLLNGKNDKVLTIWMHEDGYEIVDGFYPGSYEFDWYDNCDNTTYFTAPTTEAGTWRFAVNGVKIGNYSRTQREQAEIQAQTMLTGVPSTVYKAIVAATGARKGTSSLLDVDCNKSYPDFQFTIGSSSISASQDVYISKDQKAGQCRLLLYPTDTSGFSPAWKFGYLWFYEMCFHFNLSPPSVGFSQQTWW